MKNTNIIKILFILIAPLLLLSGCSKNKKDNSITNNNAQVNSSNSQNTQNSDNNSEKENVNCKTYKERVTTEINTYKERALKDENNKWSLIEIFYSPSLKKCLYSLKQSYTNNGKKTTDYIINNAEKEETLEIYNELDKESFDKRINELKNAQ